jgi:dUTP pyrophosphatase
MSHYILKIYTDSIDLRSKYEETSVKHNVKCDSKYFDAGFDLYNPCEIIIQGQMSSVIDYQVNCNMTFVNITDNSNNEHFVGYYLYMRSSTGTSTSLRLSNSVGIIDSGYRGNIKASFDCNLKHDLTYTTLKMNRLVQLCPPNLTYPMKVIVVNSFSDLGDKTERDISGFGSSGK